MAFWVQNGCLCVMVSPGDHGAGWGLRQLPCVTREDRTAYHCPGKEQHSKFEVQLLLNSYRFHTIIKSKNSKSDHRKAGTVYIHRHASSTAIHFRTFSSPHEETLYPLAIPHSRSPEQPHISFLSPWICLFWAFHGTILCVASVTAFFHSASCFQTSHSFPKASLQGGTDQGWGMTS